MRKDAILLLSQILYRLVDHEWKTLEVLANCVLLFSDWIRFCDLYFSFALFFSKVSEFYNISVFPSNDLISLKKNDNIHLWKLLCKQFIFQESKESSDARPAAVLSEMFVADLVNGFAKTQKWNRRQTFALLCAQASQQWLIVSLVWK